MSSELVRAEQEAAVGYGRAQSLAPSFRIEEVRANARVPIGLRLFEIAFALSAIVLTFPIMLLVAIIIRIDTKGPVLFRQKRLGVGAVPFDFYKFRTLYADARERFPDLYDYRLSEEEVMSYTFKVKNDPRVTPCGRWLRRSTLDELPNFWNVLKGDLALVGPRPEIPDMLPHYRGEMLKKFTVRPGVTGLAQVRGRGHLSFLDTVKIDVEYAETRSFLLDIKIILDTIWAVIKRDGAF